MLKVCRVSSRSEGQSKLETGKYTDRPQRLGRAGYPAVAGARGAGGKNY